MDYLNVATGQVIRPDVRTAAVSELRQEVKAAIQVKASAVVHLCTHGSIHVGIDCPDRRDIDLGELDTWHDRIVPAQFESMCRSLMCLNMPSDRATWRDYLYANLAETKDMDAIEVLYQFLIGA